MILFIENRFIRLIKHASHLMVTKCRDDETGIKLLQIFRQMVNNDQMRDKVVHNKIIIINRKKAN